MKSITIHQLDTDLATQIEKQAKREKISQNKLIKKLLRSALGLGEKKKIDHSDDFKDLYGVWSEEEFREFQENTKDLRKIDPEEW